MQITIYSNCRLTRQSSEKGSTLSVSVGRRCVWPYATKRDCHFYLQKIQEFYYDYDVFSNLATRKDSKFSMTESFTYDKLNRLETICTNGVYNKMLYLTMSHEYIHAGFDFWQHHTVTKDAQHAVIYKWQSEQAIVWDMVELGKRWEGHAESFEALYRKTNYKFIEKMGFNQWGKYRPWQ